jgi:hypothetical protein
MVVQETEEPLVLIRYLVLLLLLAAAVVEPLINFLAVRAVLAAVEKEQVAEQVVLEIPHLLLRHKETTAELPLA